MSIHFASAATKSDKMIISPTNKGGTNMKSLVSSRSNFDGEVRGKIDKSIISKIMGEEDLDIGS